MTSTLIKPSKISESAEVREYALSRALIPSPKESKINSAIDLVARIALFYVVFSLTTELGIYIWRLLTCPC